MNKSIYLNKDIVILAKYTEIQTHFIAKIVMSVFMVLIVYRNSIVKLLIWIIIKDMITTVLGLVVYN
jgi:hypothetical protein